MSDPAYAAAAFLRTHRREQITLADVADAVGYSRYHLARMFTSTVRMSPIRYLASQRFHLAKHLLLTEEMHVVDVCHEVGFSSPGTFTRRFHAEVGVAPADLRRRARGAVAARHLRRFRSHGHTRDTGLVRSDESGVRCGAAVLPRRAALGRPVDERGPERSGVRG